MVKKILFIIILLSFGMSQAVAGVSEDLYVWRRSTDGNNPPSFAAMAQLIQRRPTWPKLEMVRTQAEHRLLDQSPSDQQIVSWFDDYPPRSDRGRFAYWQALRRLNYPSDAFLREQWRKGAFNRDQQRTILSVAKKSLSQEDHVARVDYLLWQGQLDRAIDGMVSLDQGAKAWAQARVALQRFSSKAPDYLVRVPQAWRSSNGLLLDTARFYRQTQNDSKAAHALSQRRKPVEPYAAQWWRERAILVRRAMERRDFSRAYQLVAAHGFTSGLELAEAEWLAGWLATTRLGQAEKGFKHFEHMYHNVKSSLSVSRASYWAGVALDAMKQPAEADRWYGLAARHMHTFYGQMAAQTLDRREASFQAYFARAQAIPSSAAVPADLAEAARILHKQGRDEERDIFLRAAVTVLNTKKQPQAVIALAKELNSPEAALAAAKAAYENGVLVREALFPTVILPSVSGVEKALALAIIRQESMFDRTAVSSAGALGLMQLLPATAAQTARKFGVAYRGTQDLFQPEINTRLGQGYISKLLTRYDGYLPLAIAAYNAGPGNVDKWLNTMGDPRADARNWVDWVERIPFYETRNYVQRVWESYQLYKYLGY